MLIINSSRKFFLVALLIFLSIKGYSKSLPFELEADHVKFNNKKLNASGNVIVKYKQYIITASKINFDRETNIIKLKDHVVLRDNLNNKITSYELDLDLNNDTGIVKKGRIQTVYGVYVVAEDIIIADSFFRLDNLKTTQCSLSSPHYYVDSKKVLIKKENNSINAFHNVLYFYNVPIFLIPEYSQSIGDGEVSNKPTPEFGVNQVDGTYGNIYISYLLQPNILGKAGIGISSKRGLRYGALHTYTINNENLIKLKTYSVEKTGFEGGVEYQWRKITSSQKEKSLAEQVFLSEKHNEPEPFFKLSYMIDQIRYNELYDEIPHAQVGVNNLMSSIAGKISLLGGGGYFLDRSNRGYKFYFKAKSTKNLVNVDNKFHINNELTIYNNYYSKKYFAWERVYNTISFDFIFNRTKSNISYTKLFLHRGHSFFIFDSVNEIVDDEISYASMLNLNPLVLKVDANYQINKKKYRNFRYTAGWIIHCWQLNFSIDTIWKTYRIGISFPEV